MKPFGAALAAGWIAASGCSSNEPPSPASGGGTAGVAGSGVAGDVSGGSAGTSSGAGGAEAGGTQTGGAAGTTAGTPSSGGGGEPGGSSGAQSGGSSGASAGSESGGAGSGGTTAGLGGASGAGAGGSGGGPSGSLSIYLVDTEGGQATVMKLPGGEIFVVDTGNPGTRDAGRIEAVIVDELGASSVDYLLTTHYDGDHVGGATALHERTPVTNFLDHGDEGAPASYRTLANAGMRRIIEAGDTLDVGSVHFDFVSSAGELITTPLPGGGAENPYCDGVMPNGQSDENENSVGFILRFGSFDFIDLADLLWDWELRLACPVNLLGTIDLYLTTHHGLTRSGAPPLVRGIAPLAAVMNNGPRKGGGGSTWATLAQAPGATEVWQVHEALGASANENAPPDQIANLGDGQDMAHFLKITAEGSGAFTIENPRNGVSRTYQSR